MIYEIVIEKPALKYIKKQTKQEQERILRAIKALPNGDTKPIQGHKGFYRLRVGDCRIIYTLDNGRFVICIIDAGNRGKYISGINSIAENIYIKSGCRQHGDSLTFVFRLHIENFNQTRQQDILKKIK